MPTGESMRQVADEPLNESVTAAQPLALENLSGSAAYSPTLLADQPLNFQTSGSAA